MATCNVIGTTVEDVSGVRQAQMTGNNELIKNVRELVRQSVDVAKIEELVAFLCDSSVSRGLVGVAFVNFSRTAKDKIDIIMFRRGKRLLLDIFNFKTLCRETTIDHFMKKYHSEYYDGDSWEGQY
jgi:hypothetical protein